MQFNIRFLLLLTLAFAIAIATMQSVARSCPEFWLIALFAAMVLAMYGLALIAISGTIAVSILISAFDENRGTNLRRCAGIAGAGVMTLTSDGLVARHFGGHSQVVANRSVETASRFIDMP